MKRYTGRHVTGYPNETNRFEYDYTAHSNAAGYILLSTLVIVAVALALFLTSM